MKLEQDYVCEDCKKGFHYKMNYKRHPCVINREKDEKFKERIKKMEEFIKNRIKRQTDFKLSKSL